MKEYTLSIITPQGELFKGRANSLTAPGELGRFGILGDHAPMIITLKRGTMVINMQEGQKFFVLDPGVLEVKESHDVLVLVEGAYRVSSLEEAADHVSSVAAAKVS